MEQEENTQQELENPAPTPPKKENRTPEETSLVNQIFEEIPIDPS